MRVKAFGLNRMDLLQREGRYPVPPRAPSTMGVEFSGVIAGLGPEPEHGFKVGDHVFGLAYGGTWTTWLVPMHHIMRSVLTGRAGIGAYAEYLTVSTGMLIHRPAQLSWEEASGIPEVRLFCPSIINIGNNSNNLLKHNAPGW